MNHTIQAKPMKRFLPYSGMLLIVVGIACSNPKSDSGDFSDCPTAGGEQSVGPCLVAAFAGSYPVEITEGSHNRGVVTLLETGGIDYDNGEIFVPSAYEGVYDRLECCNRISVELKQRDDNNTNLAPDARHRVDIFTSGPTTGSAVVRFEYDPNWPAGQGKVVLNVLD